MTGSILQLVAKGYEDLYLTGSPQITFFKMVYRRHTNFTSETIPQYFINQPNFGTRSTCIIGKDADLIGEMHLAITLPKINKITDQRVKFAWIKKIGFGMIKSIDIEINGKIINRHYGEFMNLWAELTGKIKGNQQRGYNKMIGNIPELTEFTSEKESYTLYIPLQFWFCVNPGMALPCVSLLHSDIKINVEFNDVEKCFKLTPTHYIKCRDDIVNFEPYEYIEQVIDGDVRSGIFIDYDVATKRLYYYKISENKFSSIPVSSDFQTSNNEIVSATLTSTLGVKYLILGKSSKYTTYPEFNNFTVTYPTVKLKNLNIVSCFILVNYYFLDEDERIKFSKSSHDYLIEQLYLTPEIQITNSNFNAKIISENPCKIMIWVVQMLYNKKSKDYFNYTDSYQNKMFSNEFYDDDLTEPIGQNIIKNETILINGNPRLSNRSYNYFADMQPYLHCETDIQKGIQMYSYSNSPFITQPSGTLNTSQVANIEIKLELNTSININNPAVFRGYSVCENILRISNGLAGLVFVK